MTLCQVNIQYSCNRKKQSGEMRQMEGGRLKMKTYRVFEPGDAHHSHHDADDDGPEAEESELGGSVALVPRAVRGVYVA